MKKITTANYKKDNYYPKVVKAMNDELIHSDFVSPIEVFQRMQLLDKINTEQWRKGRITYLEKVIMCNLSKANRILKLMKFHAQDLKLEPSITLYKRKTKSGKQFLRFSKSGFDILEEVYSTHFVKIAKYRKKSIEIDRLK